MERMMDKNDIELLEFAAKAASIVIHRYNATYACYESSAGLWNPLLNDGDALRLAVKLRIKFLFNEVLGQALAWTGGIPDYEAKSSIEECGRDENRCSRRAIVRAAAEIGKSMEAK